MPTKLRILPDIGLCYVRFEGCLRPAESHAAFRAYISDPDSRPGQKQFVDLSAVTEFEPDYAALMAMQADMVGFLLAAPLPQTLIAFYAPTRLSQFLAALAQRPWRGVDPVVTRTCDTELAALEFLGLGARPLWEILEETE